jgi:hypothetical protein
VPCPLYHEPQISRFLRAAGGMGTILHPCCPCMLLRWVLLASGGLLPGVHSAGLC